MSADLISAKNAIRRQLRATLAAIADDPLATASTSIREHLTTGPESIHAGATVALFGGMAGEPDLLPLIEWLGRNSGRSVFFGFANGMLVPRLVTTVNDLQRGPFGVWIPRDHLPLIPASELEIILVPGLGFDLHGGRLGRGRGHFDRLFADPEVIAHRIGVCLSDQVIDHVPVEAHDARMTALVSDTGWVRLALE